MIKSGCKEKKKERTWGQRLVASVLHVAPETIVAVKKVHKTPRAKESVRDGGGDSISRSLDLSSRSDGDDRRPDGRVRSLALFTWFGKMIDAA